MQIHSINNKNNNPNFKQLYVTKQTLKQIGHTRSSLLEIPELRNLSQVYDVRVSQGFRDWGFNIIEKGFFREKEHCISLRSDKLTNRESMHRLKYFSLDGFSKSHLKDVLSRRDEDGNNALHGLLRFSSGLIDKVSNATTDFKSLILMKNKNGETPLDSLDGESIMRILKHLNLSSEEMKELQLEGPSLMETISESLLKDSRTFEDGVKYLSEILGEEKTRKVTQNYVNRLVTDENFYIESIVDNSVEQCWDGLIIRNVIQNVIKGLVFVNDIESVNKLFEEKKQSIYNIPKEFSHWGLCSCIEPLLASDDSGKIKKLLADIIYNELDYQHQHRHNGMTDLHDCPTDRDNALKYLKNSPEKLAKALMMKNHDKETPFHIHWRDSQFVSEIIIALKDMPSELKTILTMPSRDSKSDLNLYRYITDEKLQPILATALGKEDVNGIVQEKKEFLQELSNADLSDSNEIKRYLEFPIVKKSGGLILDTPYNEKGDTLFSAIAKLQEDDSNLPAIQNLLVDNYLTTITRDSWHNPSSWKGGHLISELITLHTDKTRSEWDKSFRYCGSYEDSYDEDYDGIDPSVMAATRAMSTFTALL